MAPFAIEVRDLTVSFDGHGVLKDFSVSIKPGELTLLTGPSGCGKSTVIRCLLGFVAPDAGSIYVDGRQMNPDTVWDIRRTLAYVGQEPELGTGLVNQILERPFHFRANATLKKNLQRIPELFERFGLARQLLDKDATALSGGEKQRISLISAILLERRIFLLDEVTSALDKTTKQIVVDYFRLRNDITALFVAHDPNLYSFVDQIVELSANRLSRGTS